jgi:ATP-dependent RNA helicase RhlE
LARQLEKDGLKTTAIHGDKSQAARLEALDDFKAAKVQVMVATDVAARGLDIDDLPLVVNYELPYVPEDYIHRIGRTGRAGASGEAISFCAPEEEKLLAEIERLLKRSIPVVAADLDTAKPEPRPRREAKPARTTKTDFRDDSEARAPRRQRDESVFDRNPDQPLTPRQPDRVAPGALTSTNPALHDSARRTQPIAALLMKRSSPEPEKV